MAVGVYAVYHRYKGCIIKGVIDTDFSDIDSERYNDSKQYCDWGLIQVKNDR